MRAQNINGHGANNNAGDAAAARLAHRDDNGLGDAFGDRDDWHVITTTDGTDAIYAINGFVVGNDAAGAWLRANDPAFANA